MYCPRIPLEEEMEVCRDVLVLNRDVRVRDTGTFRDWRGQDAWALCVLGPSLMCSNCWFMHLVKREARATSPHLIEESM